MNPIKFACKKDEICAAIGNVSKAVSPKSTITALEGIRLLLNGTSLELTGYDLEIGITTVIEVDSEDRGEIVLNSRLFSEITRRMPSDTVYFEVDENLNMKISGGNAQYQISAISAEEYPALPDISRENGIFLNQEILKSMINQTNYAVSLLDTKPILTGELFDIENGGFNMVAIDGFRLAIRHEKINASEKYYFVVPSKALMEASRLLKDDAENDCEIYVDSKYVVIEVNGYRIFTRLLEGEFIDYKKLCPREYNSKIKLKTKDLLNSIERASLLSQSEQNNLIKLSIRDSMMAITSNNEKGNVYEEVSLSLEGDYLDIAFNSRYLLEGLKNIDCEEIYIEFTTNVNPCIIKPADGTKYTYLLLPVRISSNN